MEGIDYSRLPTWIVLILLLLNLFREQIGKFVPTAIREHFRNRAENQADQREHAQRIEETLIDNELQQRVTEQLRETRREDTLIKLLQDKDRWLENVLATQLERLGNGQEKMIEELKQIRGGITRTNNILTTIHIVLSRRDHGDGN